MSNYVGAQGSRLILRLRDNQFSLRELPAVPANFNDLWMSRDMENAQRELPLSEWSEKNGVLHWCGGYAPDSLVGVYFREMKKLETTSKQWKK